MAIMTIIHDARGVKSQQGRGPGAAGQSAGVRRLFFRVFISLTTNAQFVPGLECNTRRCCRRYGGANCQIKTQDTGTSASRGCQATGSRCSSAEGCNNCGEISQRSDSESGSERQRRSCSHEREDITGHFLLRAIARAVRSGRLKEVY